MNKTSTLTGESDTGIAVSHQEASVHEADADSRTLSVIVPAFNEAEGIGPTLSGLIDAFPGAEIIVVDDYSSDATSDVAKSYKVHVVRHRFNRGQGASLKTGMRIATRPFVAWFDADNEHRCEDLARMYARARQGGFVAVIGQRSRSTSMIRGVGKWLIRLIGKGLKIRVGSDLNCGLRVFRRDVILRYLSLVPDRFSASLVTTLIMVERQYLIAFEPIKTNARIGHSTVRLQDGLDAMLVLVRSVLLFAPMRFFLPLGGILILAGLLYGLVTALSVGLGLPVSAMLVMMTGMLLIMLGLIADQVSQMRLSQLPDLTLIAQEAPVAPLEKAKSEPS
ncbi:MAG TPA: glycosyltransferase family 2 protein [Hyphomicrobium sp.]|nr:glycosyltransferase family 2 protein [Hyphomicrobium sp.]